MEANSWRSAQQEAAPGVGAGAGGEVPDWRNHLQPEARHRIVNKIMDTLKKHLPVSAPEGLSELQKIAVRFEEKIYTAATSQADYLRKISLKMLSMETKTQQPGPVNPSMSNSAGPNQNPSDPASLVMQPQGSNQGQPLPASMVNHQTSRHLPQNIQNNNLTSVQGSTNMPSGLPSISGSGQSTVSGVGMTGIAQNSATNSMQGTPSDIYANQQRQMQGRQQQMTQQQQQQSQNNLLFQQQQQQLQRQFKQKMQPSSLLQPHMQQQQLQQQQQTLLPTTQMQSSQQPLMQISSSLQSGQAATIQQTQPGLQQVSQSGVQQNQLSAGQQSMPSLLQQHSQSISRQQQVQGNTQQQTNTLVQQPASVPQQTNLPLQQHGQQLMGSQANISNIQQALLGQQTGITDMQQAQRQNNLLGIQQPQQIINQQAVPLHKQQSVGQSNMSGLQPQQQQLLGSLSGVSNMQHQRSVHMLQQSKSAGQQQQQSQQTPMSLLQTQGQQAQPQTSQQQLVSQFQSQPTQVQQHLNMQQQTNSLQRDMQQRLQSGTLLSQNAIEQQKQIVQSQRGLPDVSSSTSVDSTGQTGNMGSNDWQEEIYQKIKNMKELYFNEMNELYQKITLKLQQTDTLMPAVKQSEQYEKMKGFKGLVERMLNILQLPKASVQLMMKDKLPLYENQMIHMLATHKKKPMASAQQQLHHTGPHAQSMPQQQSLQVSQLQQHDNHPNQGQQMNLQGSATSMQSASASGVQHGSMPLSNNFSIPATQQNITSALQPGPTTDPVQGNSFGSLPQGPIGSVQGATISGQGTMNVPQQTISNSLTHSSMNTLQSGAMQPTPNALQQQHLKQQQQEQQNILQAQQLKQLQQRQLQQQMFQQKQQLLQSQQPLQQQFQQQKQQQAALVPSHPQLHQANEANDVKVRQGPGMRAGLYQQQQQHSGGQRLNYYQQHKPGVAFPISSPQNLQASSPQISHQSSPQIDQHNLLPAQVKAGTPLQAANSPFAPSPSTPIAPSPIPGDSEKPLPGMPNSGLGGHQLNTLASTQAQSHPVAIPGMSASPLLAEFASPDVNQTNLSGAVTHKTSAAETPVERLLRAVRNSSPNSLSSAVKDIASVISMIDRIAGSAPGNGSRAAVGEDLVAMTKCRLQARNFISQDGNSTAKKIKRNTSAMPLNNVLSVGSVNDSFIKSHGLDASELESTATSRSKRRKHEVNHSILEEIKKINQQLIDTEVKISEEDVDSAVLASEGDGVVIKCSYLGVALSPSLKSQIASSQMSPIQPLRLLVPASYPKNSPVLLDIIPDESKDSDDLSAKAKSRFGVSLRGLSQPMSLWEMARTWDACTRIVITEYAQKFGGGTFSSTYGTWESCVGA